MKHLFIFLWSLCTGTLAAADRPNILWITCEDISPYLGCYGFEQAQTPHLDRLASQGIRFTRAYANAPVCAVARSTLLTGMHATTIGTHPMRCDRQLPATIPAYPKLFRKAGYYCTNNVKTDYNSNLNRDRSLWNESSAKAHFRKRQPGQPFFAVFNIATTHESQLAAASLQSYIKRKLIPKQPRIDPTDIILPPYHPDLPEIRRDWARLHDLITAMDSQAGKLLAELEADGQAENTIVFFYSDHGGQLARSKRYIYNVGTQVPLIVRIPQKWRHLAAAGPGGTSDRLVCFADLPKTVLSLAGIPVPDLMQGSIFLGPATEPAPETVHFYRDRMAEADDFCRAVTDGRYTCVRNFMPHRPQGRDSRYGYTVQANWRAWEIHYEAGLCDPLQSQFYQPKPVVELFDTEADPWHVRNLADQPEHRGRVARMQKEIDRWMIRNRDCGLIPEAMFADLAGPGKPHQTLYEYARSDEFPVEEILRIAREATLGDAGKLPAYIQMTRHPHPAARFQGAYGLFLVRSASPDAQSALESLMRDDPMAANRIMAAQALGLSGKPEAAFKALYQESKAATTGFKLLLALNAIRYAHLDERLTLDDWKTFREKSNQPIPGDDPNGLSYARRVIDDAIALWPQRRKVD
jgi:N-sulfoglucosamine sulfohydrolase